MCSPVLLAALLLRQPGVLLPPLLPDVQLTGVLQSCSQIVSPWSEPVCVDALFQVQALVPALVDLHSILLAHLLQLMEGYLNGKPTLQSISHSLQFRSLLFLPVLIAKPLLVYSLAEFWISQFNDYTTAISLYTLSMKFSFPHSAYLLFLFELSRESLVHSWWPSSIFA